MLYIHHYYNNEGNDEYIILTMDPEFDIEGNAKYGYHHEKVYEFSGDNPSSLPLDRELIPGD